MLPMRFAFYQDIERARNNPWELDKIQEQIEGCGQGYEGDLFHLAHVRGVHTGSIIRNAIERAEEEGEPLYAALMMMADINIDPHDWDRLVGIVATAEDVEVLWNVFRLCGTYAQVMCQLPLTEGRGL
jgi:hypothetical protein